MNNMMESLDKGWTVSNVANVLARGQNDEGSGFLVTVAESKKHLSCEVYLPYSPEVVALLTNASA